MSDCLWARLVPVPYATYLHLRAFRQPLLPERRVVRSLGLFNVQLAIWLSLLAVVTGGLTSPLQATVMFVPLTIMIIPSEWKRTAWQFTGVLVSYLLTMVVGSALRFGNGPFGDPQVLLTFAFWFMVIFGMAASMTLVSHMLWTLRREVFEAKSVGKYRLKRLLGRGGMGEVWAAYHAGLRREVALKLLNVGDERGPVAAKRFEREVHAMTKLTHPNTVRVFDFGAADGGLMYYAMELLEGEHLGRLVKREGPLPPARVRHFALQASRALGEAHDFGIVHRDVKPENLFITTAGGERDYLKVLDFGIATHVDHDGHKLTQTGSVAGTPGTVSPEVIQGRPATPASDVYSLGAVMYLMLTGTLPFDSEQVMTVMLAHLHDTPIPPSVRRGEPVATDLETLVLRCLDKEPTNRFKDGRALADALVSCTGLGTWNPADAPLPTPLKTRERLMTPTPDARTRPLAITRSTPPPASVTPARKVEPGPS
ncbi:MAG: serine/threonine-protein kinase [Polyangiales bacterium]